MAFNPVDKHSRLKLSVSEKNGIYCIFKAWASSAGIAIGHRLDTPGSVPRRDNTFSLFHSIQTDSGSNPAPKTIYNGQWWLYPLSLHDIVLN
jgi:hypothetical protein